MAQEWAEQFYNSTAWKRCRDAYKAMVHYQCEMCHGVGEIVHHKERLTRATINDMDVSLNFRNLRLLCRKCHGAVHGVSVTMDDVYFDDAGNLVPIPPVHEI